MGEREVLLSLAATEGPLPAAVATKLGEGAEPARLLRPHSPEPGAVAAGLDALGVRFLVPGDDGWPLAASPPDPPCAWLFVAGPAPPGPAASVAVVGGRRASPLRRTAARTLAAGLASAGWCVVSGGAVGVDAAAHAGALDAGGATVVVLGCGLDVPYPRANTGLFARVRAAGGTVLGEHPPGSAPRAAHFLPRNRLIAALAAAVVVVEAAEGSGSLSTARAAGSRGAGRVLVLPGAPWDPGAAGCNQLIRDGATLVRSLSDILEDLGAATPSHADHGAVQPWSGLEPSARAVLAALVDGQVLGLGRLATATGLPPAELDAALLDLELAGLIRRTAAGAQAVALPPMPSATGARRAADAHEPALPSGRPDPVASADTSPGTPAGASPAAAASPVPPLPESRGPPASLDLPRVLEPTRSGRDDGGDDRPPRPPRAGQPATPRDEAG